MRPVGLPLRESVSSLCRGHANLLCIVPIFSYVTPTGTIILDYASRTSAQFCIWFILRVCARDLQLLHFGTPMVPSFLQVQLTVNTAVYAFLASVLALSTAWSFLVHGVSSMFSFSDRSTKSLEVSQCATLLTRAPLAPFLTAGQLAHRGRPKHTPFMIAFASIC